MGHVIGIDLGTTNSCIAHFTGEHPRVIPNLEGSPTTPSVVSFAQSGETLVGSMALKNVISNPERTLFATKRLIGRKFKSEEVRKARERLPYKLAEALNGDVVIEVDSQEITPQEVSAMILDYLKRCAESYLGGEVRDAVLTVPAHFDDHQRQATKDAAFIAGFNVLRVINEPTAASLAFGLRQKEGGKLAIFDLGGGTFDISVLEISDGVFHVLATNGDSYLGGEDFDRRIVDWLLEGMRRDSGRDFCPDKFALQRIKEAAEEAKRELSFTTEIEINVPFVSVTQGGAISVKRMLTRSILEDLTRNLVERPFPLVQKTLQESGLKPGDIDSVLLVGGQTRMPLVRRRVADFFQKEPDERIHPQESVALGAALQGGILNGDIDEIVLLLDVTSKSLGIETEQDGYEKIIEKNTTVPTKKIRPFTTVENNQRKVSVHVLQGEGLRASDNVSLARFDLVGIVPAPAGIPQIDVTFEIDADGLVKVSARDISSGKEQQIAVQPSSGLTKQQITNLVHERREKRSKEKTDAKKGLL